jgi:hypothetical protein
MSGISNIKLTLRAQQRGASLSEAMVECGVIKLECLRGGMKKWRVN